MVFARNIDDMMRAEEQIQKLSSAVESSINGIVIGDVEGNLTFVNNSFLKMWGYKNQNEVLGRNAAQFWKVNDRAAEIENSLQSGEGWIGELTAVRKDGSLFDIQVCQTSIRGENGTITSLMASFVDITESKRKEEELSKYRGQMARAEQLASLGTLSATVAHQLTQPLTVIRLSMDNALDELEATSSSETVIRRLKESVTQVSNITSIIGNFRNFARKSSGKTITEVNLKAVAVRIATLLSESARSANIVLRVGDISELPCPWMNETDLEQLFFALIENSIQAADGEKTRQLVISGVLKDKHIELRITDDCGGIAPENLDKIFEPFFTTKPRGQGTGLGLCIVQDVVSRIGGHVRIESEFGKGTTFIINIPIEKDKIS
jgi:PAS domain S-box-containing protein